MAKQAVDSDIKILLQVVADLVQLGSDLSGGLSFSEIGDLIKLATDVPSLLSVGGVLFPEYAALDDAARADLEAFVAANVKLPSNVNVQMYIQKALDVGIALSAVAQVLA